MPNCQVELVRISLANSVGWLTRVEVGPECDYCDVPAPAAGRGGDSGRSCQRRLLERTCELITWEVASGESTIFLLYYYVNVCLELTSMLLQSNSR